MIINLGKYQVFQQFKIYQKILTLQNLTKKLDKLWGNLSKVETNQFKNNFIISLNVVKASSKELLVWNEPKNH